MVEVVAIAPRRLRELFRWQETALSWRRIAAVLSVLLWGALLHDGVCSYDYLTSLRKAGLPTATHYQYLILLPAAMMLVNIAITIFVRTLWAGFVVWVLVWQIVPLFVAVFIRGA